MVIDYCHAAVTRRDEMEPCDKPAVTLRNDDPESDRPYPVCRRHAGPSALGVVLESKPTLDALTFAPVWLHVMARWTA